jgi:hypothetical protein
MKEMKIEWAIGLHLSRESESEWDVPVVRLEAVDQVIAGAVLFAAAAKSDIVTVGTVKQAEAFLNSEIVAKWRKRQAQA